MAYTYYIDAYNLLYHSDTLRSLLAHDFEAARDAFIDKIARFCGVTGEVAKVVFDGRGRRADSAPPPCGTAKVEVVYAPAHQSADAFIERAVFQSPHRRQIIVVSGDRGIRDLCLGMGSLAMKPGDFLATVQDASNQVSDAARQTVTQRTMGGIESRLDDAALAKLQALRDKLKPE